MEDAATAEIARSQVWQWRANDVVLDDGTHVTTDVVRQVVAHGGVLRGLVIRDS
jgi:malate synthase